MARWSVEINYKDKIWSNLMKTNNHEKDSLLKIITEILEGGNIDSKELIKSFSNNDYYDDIVNNIIEFQNERQSLRGEINQSTDLYLGMIAAKELLKTDKDSAKISEVYQHIMDNNHLNDENRIIEYVRNLTE